MLVHSNSDSIGKLKTVLVGNVSTKTLLQESKEWNVPFKQLKEECEEDRAYFVKVLKQLGIDVVEIPFIDEMIKEYNTFGDLDNPDYEDTDRIYKTIENILAERKQDKARIKELEEENRIQRRQLNSAFDRGWIPKEKVKEGLERIEDYFYRLNGPDEDMEYIRNIKKELLEDK